MKNFLIRNQARLIWLLAVVGVVTIIYILFSINIATDDNVTDIKRTIKEVEDDLEKERVLREERLVGYTTCLLKTPLEQRTDERVSDCREASGLSRTPPPLPTIKIDGGTKPSDPIVSQPSQSLDTSSLNSSSFNTNAPEQSTQRESSQSTATTPAQQEQPKQTQEPSANPSILETLTAPITNLLGGN